MKKLLTLALAVLMALSLTACGGSKTEEDTVSAADDGVFKMAVLVPYFGDQSYYDTLKHGAEEIDSWDNAEVRLIEVGSESDEATWVSAFDDVCEDGEYDLVVSGNETYEAYLYAAAKKYPEQKFYNFDYLNFEDLPNVYGVRYNTAELGYVIGALCAALTKTDKVGVVVGMDNQSMNQFISGFCQILAEKGKQYYIAYPGSWTDTILGKEITEQMIDGGADLVWQVAGGLGNGVIEACSNHDDVWAVGVDCDQHESLKENKALSDAVITSALKQSDVVLINFAKDMIEGKDAAKWGTCDNCGIALQGVGIAENDYYLSNVDEATRNSLTEILNDVVSGKTTVIDCMTWSAEEYETKWPELRNAAQIELDYRTAQ